MIQVGDIIQILTDDLDSAGVKAGELHRVKNVRVNNRENIEVEEGWRFMLRHENIGWRKVEVESDDHHT